MKGKIFNTQAVQAIIAGNKTMFREVCKKQDGIFLSGENGTIAWHKDLSKFEVGQEIFVKEAFLQKLSTTLLPCGEYRTSFTRSKVEYIADGAKARCYCRSDCWGKRPAQHMKQKQSRITLRIKSVKVERLQDISERDAEQEGFYADSGIYYDNSPKAKTASDKFKQLWDSTHKKQEHKWEANPWVFVYEFEIKKND